MHWLCSALYETLSRRSMSGISLTKLLRGCNIKLYEFLKKTERFLPMVQTSRDCSARFREFCEGLSVSLLAYEKYKALFNDIFVSPNYSEEAALAAVTISTPQKGGKKSKSINKCTPNNVYEFCWYLFLSANCENPSNTIDLVTSYHIILCCIDIVYSNIVADKRDDLLNMDFAPTAAALAAADNKKASADAKPVSILTEICNIQKANLTDVLAVKSHNWRNLITNYFSTNLLKGNATTFLGLFSAQNFDHNIDSLRKKYEAYALSAGKIDESIFLWQPQPTDSPSEGMHSQLIRSMQPETPLTRRSTLPHRDPILASPVSNATQNVNRLHQHLDGVGLEPGAALRELLRSCKDDPLPGIESLKQVMRQQFCDAFRMEASNERFELALKLFYRLLENIIRKEKSQRQNFDQKVGAVMTLIMKLLLATSVEITIYAYGASARFPWILQCFEIEAFYFYKLIEIIVTNHEGILNRDLIKHLNAVSCNCPHIHFQSPYLINANSHSTQIEEQCLEQLAWHKGSPLWTHITDYLKINPSLPKQGENPPGQIGLFFRKFWILAFLRMQKMANDLKITEDNLQKIWTTFENSILNNTDLMKDRHLDQLLMCSIYIFARVCNLPIQFKDIMTVYRLQPQAQSHIYRKVLGSDGNRCDIIDFYNRIYVVAMQEFALRLRATSAEDVEMSPLPINVRYQQSPRKVSKNHSIYVQELQSNETLQSPRSASYTSFTLNTSPVQVTDRRIRSISIPELKTLHFCFRSQDLSQIKKRFISDTQNSNGKRTVPFAGFDEQQIKEERAATERPPTVPYTNKKLRSMMTDRQEKTDK